MNQSAASLMRVATAGDLVRHELLEALLGPIASLTVEPMATPGYSGASLDRVEVRLHGGGREHLVRKRVRLAADWTAYRTDDLEGREAALLAEPRLHGVWDVLVCPYRAYAATDGELGLLMTDLGDWLLADADIPLAVDQEDLLLGALAGVHATYWQADVLDELGWLARPAQVLGVLGPDATTRNTGPQAEPLFEMIRAGWARALTGLPRSIAGLLLPPAGALAVVACDGLPRTLLHGDAKVANFALPPAGVAAFDWSWVGAGPCTLDLGWYLAVNAGRLARPKEDVVSRYRMLLERALGSALPDGLWDRLRDFAVLAGARMLLWQKALAVDEGSPWAASEWAWWVEALERLELPELEVGAAGLAPDRSTKEQTMTTNQTAGQLYVRAMAWTQRYLDGVRDDQWHAPTPCSEWDVKRVANHVIGENLWAVELFQGKTVDQVGSTLDGDLAGVDPAAAYQNSLAAAKMAVETPGAMEATCHLSFGDHSGADYASQLFMDTLIHGWDIAKATGQDARLDGELVAACLPIAQQLTSQFCSAGIFGEDLPVEPSADSQTRLLAFVGRRAQTTYAVASGSNRK